MNWLLWCFVAVLIWDMVGFWINVYRLWWDSEENAFFIRMALWSCPPLWGLMVFIDWFWGPA